MMKNNTIVIFNSQTGFTKKYAEWISEALSCECIELSKVKNDNLDKYETIIFGGWLCGGNVSKLKWFRDNIPNWKDKHLAVYCVGGSPIYNPDIKKDMKHWLSEEEHKIVSTYYCPGGINYEKMPIASSIAMKMFTKTVKMKKNKTEEEKEMAEMITKSYDISDKKYIEPIVAWAKSFM